MDRLATQVSATRSGDGGQSSMRESRAPSVDQLQRKLNLPRIARGPADLAKARTRHDVGRHPHRHNVEQIEKLRAELHIHALGPALSSSEWGVLDEREVVVVERRPAEAIAAERPEATLVGTAP